ncbi:aminotransferase class V-fold PLP-dependent enzyme [Desulfitobacterium sp. THU1]|uniref:aminotransferase class V-fold PLP-dependent enzyme n=1 Tax=Desulfitobacterium sp. THU1 TaxID=3138072 RepID=UPI00311FE02F
MIYLDNAATTLQKPAEVKEAVIQAMNTLGNASRGAHPPALNALRTLMDARMELADFFGLQDPLRVIFTANATAALNLAIGSIRGHIVTSATDHNSVLRPVYRQGNYTVVPADEKGRIPLDQITAALRPDTEAVVMTHASNVTGNVFDIEAIGELCAARGVRLIVDASQSAGLLPIRMHKTISALCFTGHKSLYGPQGTGGLCLGEGFQPSSLLVGGSGHHTFDPRHPEELPDALEAGTQNVHGIAGLLAGVRYIRSTGLTTIYQQADALARTFAQAVVNLPKVTVYGDMQAPVRVPIVSLNIEGYDCAQGASLLYENYGICVRAGAHCSPLIHKKLDLDGSIRFSFSHFNTLAETERAIEAVQELAK